MIFGFLNIAAFLLQVAEEEEEFWENYEKCSTFYIYIFSFVGKAESNCCKLTLKAPE